jgi:hypothetical protein
LDLRIWLFGFKIPPISCPLIGSGQLILGTEDYYAEKNGTIPLGFFCLMVSS